MTDITQLFTWSWNKKSDQRILIILLYYHPEEEEEEEEEEKREERCLMHESEGSSFSISSSFVAQLPWRAANGRH